MPVIKVWCLPQMTENQLKMLHKNIVGAVVDLVDLGLKDENDMTCLFPPDSMSYGLGEEIIIEVTGLFEKPGRTEEVRQNLAQALGFVVHSMFLHMRLKAPLIECFVYPFNPVQGFWTNRRPG
ncbi:MAG: hypothetical protein Q8P23_03770 [bacterium]|nr:hypothetical protein [bacterium]